MPAERAEPEVETFVLGSFDAHGTTRAPYRGRSIEVEHGIPGETVRAEVVGGKRPRGRIVEILDPSPERVFPPCPYFREWQCGGCQWQMLAYPAQLAVKRTALDIAMRGAQLDVTVSAIHALPEPWRYRSTAGIALGRSAGFRRAASLAIVPLHDCPISHPAIGRLMAVLNEAIGAGTIPDYRGRVRVDVRVIEGDRLQTAILETDENPQPLDPLTALLSDLDDIASVAVTAPSGIRAVKGDLLAPTLVGDRPVWLAAPSFFQTNLLLLPEMITCLQEAAAPLAGTRVADVYGGVGVLGLFLAAEADEVVEIEADALAVRAGERTAQEWGLSNVRFVTGRAEEALEGGFDVVMVDPPRSGLTPPVIDTLVRERPPTLLYVSCLPQSLARDLVPLAAAGYRVETLEMFDFYPQTYHIESLAVLRAE
ncbi:MAG TPA: 23S rRNA (uracil(1939)-C(5))-methyltransferase RlmD [Chloroflexota bacterium]|nr:23S rRNA (uracil(1939)-C(5))-methyltransferase RlmD [Chloroflexota bacterium]